MPDVPAEVADDLTPVVTGACQGCGRARHRVVAAPPETAAAAWGRAGPELKCYVSDDGTWTWCSGTGDLTHFRDDGVWLVVPFERRFRKRPAADDPVKP